jgi:mannose-6-phosphate isomerase-like protein (cupin superfamily)
MKNSMNRFAVAGPEGNSPELTIFGGSRARIVTRGADHDGRLTVIDYLGMSRGNPPPFTRHDFEEIFCVVAGRLAFQFLDEPFFSAGAGDVINVSGGCPHTFWNPDDTPVHVLLVAAPAGLEVFFEESAAVLERQRAGELEAEAASAELDRVRERHGIEVVAPPPTI